MTQDNEAFENSYMQELFDHMHDEYGLILTCSEMESIKHAAKADAVPVCGDGGAIHLEHHSNDLDIEIYIEVQNSSELAKKFEH